MKHFILLVLVVLVTADNHELGDRIVATEQECDRLYKLNENWSTSAFQEQAVQYVDLYFLCLDSLAEDKYAYIDKNHVDMSQYPGEDDKFPVMTSEGEKLVTKPVHRTPKDVESMKHKLADYLKKAGGRKNPLYKLMSIQSELSQEIVDQQVECEILALFILKHPENEDSKVQHTECMNKLNCLKEKFMAQHKFTREDNPDFFPILYKGRGTMIKTPPKSENSLCETPLEPEEHKKEFDKWVEGIEVVGDKLGEFGHIGTDMIQKLRNKGMGGADKVLTKEELDDLMTNVQSVTLMDDDDEDDDDSDSDNGDKRIYQVYGDELLKKLAELEAKGVEIAHSKIENAKPTIQKVENFASSTSEQLKKLEDVKIKPAIKKTAKGLSDAESQIKTKSKTAFEEVKDDLTVAEGVAKVAASKAKEDSSILMTKLMSKTHVNKNSDESEQTTDGNNDENEQSKGWLSSLVDKVVHSDYLPDNYDNLQKPGLLKILREMGGRSEDGIDKLSDEELTKMLKQMKDSAKKKAKDLNLQKHEVHQAAAIVKGIMHSVLTAASYGRGVAKDMESKEIDTARSLVDQLVDFAAAEILNDEDEDDDDEGDVTDEEANHVVKKDNAELHTTDATQEDVDATQKDVDATQQDVDATQQDVDATQQDVDATQQDVDTTQEDVDTTSDQETSQTSDNNTIEDQTENNAEENENKEEASDAAMQRDE